MSPDWFPLIFSSSKWLVAWVAARLGSLDQVAVKILLIPGRKEPEDTRVELDDAEVSIDLSTLWAMDPVKK